MTTNGETADDVAVVGEVLGIDERLIVSEANGLLALLPQSAPAIDGDISPGEPIATVGKMPVLSAFAGRFMGWLVLPGERVHRHQAIAWLAPRAPACAAVAVEGRQ